jgi:hypothetical protein
MTHMHPKKRRLNSVLKLNPDVLTIAWHSGPVERHIATPDKMHPTAASLAQGAWSNSSLSY